MAGNPRWCLTLAEWKRSFGRWIYEPSPQDLLNAAIFFDLRPIYGADRLAEELRELAPRDGGGSPAVPALHGRERAEVPAAARHDPRLRVRQPRRRTFPRTLELKMYGSRPFVDAARILALANRVPHTSTAERLRAASPTRDTSARRAPRP